MGYLYRDRAAAQGPRPALAGTSLGRHADRAAGSLVHVEPGGATAFRPFWRTPIISATALLTIAAGVGSSTAIFASVYGVLLRPLLNHLTWTERAAGFVALGSLQRSHPPRAVVLISIPGRRPILP
jgi:hypothetical protein